MHRAAIALARASGRLSRTLGQGGGTSLPGRVLLALSTTALVELAGGIEGGVSTVSGTNGKTTTTRMVTAGLRAEGRRVRTNRAGANLLSGVATALLDEGTRDRRSDVAIFEVDEFALAEVVERIPPRGVLLMNLFRDQLDRYGELEEIATRWQGVVSRLPAQTVVIVNADDPLVFDVARGRDGALTFGIEDTSNALGALPHAADSVRCRRCSQPLRYDAVLMGHLGHWHCDACGWRRPTPDFAVSSALLDGVTGSRIEIDTPSGTVRAALELPGLHNVANAAGATALLVTLGCPTDGIGRALSATRAAFGRAERIAVNGREMVFLLAKNPTGANENVRTVLLDDGPLHVLLALNDRAADGRDISWIWDVDFEPLFARSARLTLCGTRASDLALRAKYAGVPADRMDVLEDPTAAIDHALGATPPGGRVYVLPTYTAMLELRTVLESRGLTSAFWKDGE